MRLLHFNHYERLVSTDFRGKTIPPYAILSHRWESSEVLFADLGRKTCKEKDGYRKLEFCAKQAVQDGLQYFWVDTCCIDKWNLRELSKSINSMFQWYRDAAKCYVFLSDVSVPTTIETPQQSDWEASFRASKWFTRGWTLQELIAPKTVEFFSSEGRWIGDKTTLGQLVYETTSIPLAALQNRPLTEFTVSERMDWGKSRETTEAEDGAYCLLGLLDVAMPISYGEGRMNALARLQAEVEAAGSAPSIIPFSRNRCFVGQEPQLAELAAKLFGDQQTTTLAIVGPGGTGKSQLALEFAYRTRQKNEECSIFWVDAGNLDSLYHSYASIAQKLDIPGWDDEKADVRQLVKLHLERESAEPCLLIFDNLEDRSLGSRGLSTAGAADVGDYLPQSKLCSILITTTNSDLAKRLALQNVVELPGMTPDTAQKMLENHMNTRISRSEQEEVGLLLQKLSYLPLAIVQAAAYIKANGMTLQQYRPLLDRQKDPALERSNESLGDRPQGHATKNPVATTLFISMEQIRQDNALAADYLLLAACVDRKDIPLDLLDSPSYKEKEDAIRVLNSYALIARRPADTAFDLHRLVHSALREWLQRQKFLGQWVQHTITRLLCVFPDTDHSSRSKWRRLLPHVKYVLAHDLAEQDDGKRLILTRMCATALYLDGRCKEAEVLFVQVTEESKKVLGHEHPDTLTSMAGLAGTYRDQGRWKEAEELLEQAIETRKRVLGDEHSDTLTSMGNLAMMYSDQGRWKEAEELEVQVMQTRKRVFGGEHISTLQSIGNLAALYWKQGRWKETEELSLQVMETRKKVLGDEHPDTLTSMGNLAMMYSDKGQWKKAEELQEQVIETRKRVLGDEHPNTLTSMGNLAATYRDQGRWKEAEELQAQVTETKMKLLGDEHPDTLITMGNLALTYRRQGRWKEAEELNVQVMETRKRGFGNEHPDTLISMANLAATYRDQGRWKEAEELNVQVTEIMKRALGDGHHSTLVNMANLALIYSDQGQWKKAEELNVQVMETRKRVLGDEHPDTLTSMTNLATTYRNQGRWKEAEELEVQVMEKRKKSLGDEHHNTLISMARLVATYWNLGQRKEAEKLNVEVTEIRKKVLGDEHPSTLASMANLASIYRNQGRWKEAEELEVQVMETRKRVLGDEHPDTLRACSSLASTLMSQGRKEEADLLTERRV
jgi:tetratricopeptide (TPR) repeat protein